MATQAIWSEVRGAHLVFLRVRTGTGAPFPLAVVEHAAGFLGRPQLGRGARRTAPILPDLHRCFEPLLTGGAAGAMNFTT